MVVAFLTLKYNLVLLYRNYRSVSYKWVFPFFYDSILETSTIPKLHNF